MLQRSSDILRSAQHFNATTSDIAFGTEDATQAIVAQTNMAMCLPRGSGENGFAYLLAKVPSGGTIGPRMYIVHNLGAPRFAFGGMTLGGGGNDGPLKNGADNSVVYNKWNCLCATWNGGTAPSTDIVLRVGIDGARLKTISTSTSSAGNGGGAGGAGNNLHVGNREGGDRTFNGTIAWVARWNRVLSVEEQWIAQRFGPLSVPKGLVLFWANGRDYSASRLRPTSIADVVSAPVPPNRELGYPDSSLIAQIISGGGPFALGSVTLGSSGILGISGSVDSVVVRYWRMPTTAANGTSRTMVVMADDMSSVIDLGTAVVTNGFFELAAGNQATPIGTKHLAIIHNWDGNLSSTSIRGGAGLVTVTG